MALTLITGPMKSAKTLELISMVTPYEIAGQSVVMVQPVKNTRDDGLSSRSGLKRSATKVVSLADIVGYFDVIAIDEVHMFDSEADHETLRKWLLEGKQVVAAGLDTDYKGKFMTTVKFLYELSPDTIVRKHSVCEVCQSLQGSFTEILDGSQVVKDRLPAVVPEDGTFVYRTVCRECFFS